MDYKVENIYGKIKNKSANVSVGGSKSVTVRAMLAAALAEGDSVLYNASDCEDTKTFLSALNSFGIRSERAGSTVKIQGCGGDIPNKRADIYVGDCGTAARFLLAVAALSGGAYTFTSSAHMCSRPIKPLICALQSLGAAFSFLGEEYCFPLKIRSAEAPAERVVVDITQSSQFLSAILLAAPLAKKPLLIIPKGEHGGEYVAMTEDVMWSFGVNAVRAEGGYAVCGTFLARRYDIEPDLSSACYFYAANRILGTDIKVVGVMPHFMQCDGKFINFVKNFNGGVADMSAFPDQTLTLAAVAPYLSRPTQIMGVAHIRGQECDRIAAACHNLRAMGVSCKEEEGGLTVYPAAPHGAEIQTFGDHRVAMAFALTGLRTDGVIIKGAEVCAKTFANYFNVLSYLCKYMAQ